MSDVAAVVVAILGGLGTLCAGVWWLSRLSLNSTQTSRDVSEIKTNTKQISETMVGIQHHISDHGRRIGVLEKEIPKCEK